jgi:Lrp/AsnC family transcriptional regulator, leucine-responsive regulatory protein
VKTVVLDETDRRILNMLVENGRSTYSRLGQEVGLSPHGVADRVRRLQAAGVITGFTALIDLESLGRRVDAIIDVRLLPSTSSEHFERVATELPSVQDIAFVTGRFDYQVRAACQNTDDLDRTVRALRERAGAAQTETRIVLRSRSLRGRPQLNA